MEDRTATPLSERLKARADNLIIQPIETGEVLVYDVDTHRAHALNPIASEVWRLCDGHRTVTDLVRAIGDTHGVSASEAEAIVLVGLEHLSRARLLAEQATPSRIPRVVASRRQLVRGGLLLVPVVLSITAPTAMAAGSGCKADAEPCVSAPECCSVNCPAGTCIAGAF